MRWNITSVPGVTYTTASGTRYRCGVRPDIPVDGAATLLLSVALSRQMTRALSVNHYTAAQKQDAHDYYFIMRAFIASAFEHIATAGTIDQMTRSVA